jgi:lipopolysaccharide/colanic/teichoic acid biosynthesis glycosyltransferase
MIDGRHRPGPVLTQASDPRVTWFGRYIRKWKLDELPQLFNVLEGNMSFVGPRPQPTKLWVDPALQEEALHVLSVRPGLTSHATLNFRNEEELLADVASHELEDVYLKTIMPLKLHMELEYLRDANFWSDLSIILKTVFRIVRTREDENGSLVKEHIPRVAQKKLGSATGPGD